MKIIIIDIVSNVSVMAMASQKTVAQSAAMCSESNQQCSESQHQKMTKAYQLSAWQSANVAAASASVSMA